MTDETPEQPEDDEAMGFVEHLSELRTKLLRSVVALIPAVAIAWHFKEEVFQFLIAPLPPAWETLNLPGEPVLRVAGTTDAFMMYMKNSVVVGIIIASPVIFWQLWGFIAPGLYRKERLLALPFILVSTLCFVGGAFFCYLYVVPEAFTVLLGFTSDTLVPELYVDKYMPFFRKMLIAFGVVFEVPVVVTFLAGAGIVNWKQLLRFSRWWIVCAAFMSMLLTPQDIYTMILMLVPLVLLYFVGVGAAFLISLAQRKKA